MPKRKDIKKILIIGSGPIVIGQACEFDYSGSQACKVLKKEGYSVVLVNSNPATIMTDPEMADRTYIEPLKTEILEKIIAQERPDAILPTLGGQVALNLTVALAEQGVLKKYGVEPLGANIEAIRKGEDRLLFKKTMQRIGLDLPKSEKAYTIKEALRVVEKIGFPLVIRPSFNLGGTGASVAYDKRQFEELARRGLESSMISEVIIEESVIGWKEYELEVMRDKNDNALVVCSIENVDPMGVHTGDSITVSPVQTLTDKEYQRMRNAAISCLRAVGVETGGSNVQFAVNPKTGRMVIIEMNPRVSRSSALASKATGFPIAKIAAKLAIGYTLDEIPNDITQKTPACFEPAIDYCVVKIPRFTFEKFPEAEDILGVSMKSVGETMSIGRTFKEALQKALRGLETGHIGLDNRISLQATEDKRLMELLRRPNSLRLFYIKYALKKGYSVKNVSSLTQIDPWFIENIRQIVELEKKLKREFKKEGFISTVSLRKAKEYGFSDSQIAEITNQDEYKVRGWRRKKKIFPTFKLVDTCAAEFEARTPYYYSTYEDEDEAKVTKSKKIIILGGGPNRIGQGIEFDYCCCHAAQAVKELGYEAIMVNSNPETVSTDYDTSDRLYFEPLTFEDVMNIIEKEKPEGVIVQFGGQTPLNLARKLRDFGAPIIGTSVESIDKAEDRDRFAKVLRKIGISQPLNGSAVSYQQIIPLAKRIGFPVLVRPSYVLGGRAMRIVYNEQQLLGFIKEARESMLGFPVLIDKFLEEAVEVDVDAVSDGKDVWIGGIMEHIEQAGIHSGDSACVLPAHTLSDETIKEIKRCTFLLAQELKVKGLINIQFAIKGDDVFVLEVNPRASRTVPFVSKATGLPLAKIATKIMLGMSLKELGLKEELKLNYFSVKESVLPFSRFSGIDILLGPEMKSTGEVMGIDSSFGMAFYKSQMAANQSLPLGGMVFISVRNSDKREIVFVARRLKDMGFDIIATKGTAKALASNNIKAKVVGKISDNDSTILELIKKRELKLIINTPSGPRGHSDMRPIRSLAVSYGIPCITTIQGAQAAVCGIDSVLKGKIKVKPLQKYYQRS